MDYLSVIGTLIAVLLGWQNVQIFTMKREWKADKEKIWNMVNHHGHTCCSEKPSKVYINGA